MSRVSPNAQISRVSECPEIVQENPNVQIVQSVQSVQSVPSVQIVQSVQSVRMSELSKCQNANHNDFGQEGFKDILVW